MRAAVEPGPRAFSSSLHAFGTENFHASNFTSAAIIATATDSASGHALFGSMQIAANGTALFERYGRADPSPAPSKTDMHENAGIALPANANRI